MGKFGWAYLGCGNIAHTTAKEAEEIYAYAAQEGVYVSEAMWTWHNALSHKVKDFVTAGKLGTIQSVDCSYALPTLKFYKSDRLMNPLQIGGAEYLDSEITLGVDNTWQFWMHDPDGNPFEIMEYTPESLQVTGMVQK